MDFDFESVADALSTLNKDGIALVSRLAEQQQLAQKQVDLLEENLKDAKKKLREVAEELLPEAMKENNMLDFTLLDGSKVEVSKFYGASISKGNQGEAFHWLIENGHGDLIKNQVSTNFVRGQEQDAENFADELNDRGMPVNTKKWVEPMTLKAFARDQLEKGTKIPMDVFGIYIGNKAKITRKQKG